MIDAASLPLVLTNVVVTIVGVPAMVAGLYLLVLALASFSYRESSDGGVATARLAVLVPAHNEADLIRRCVESLLNQDYPASQFEVTVIADNCTDHTGRLARDAGASVLVRDEPDSRGKGRALRWAMDQLSTSSDAPDAFVIVDADSVAEPGLLSALARRFSAGAEAVQAEYLVLDGTSSRRVGLRAVAFLLFHRVRFAGRAALGLPCSLVGNGMLLGSDLIERLPWNAFTGAEDLEYSVNLRLAEVSPVFAGAATVRGPMPASKRSAALQRDRWEGGRLHVIRTALPRVLIEIIFRRRGALLDLAVDLAVPPLSLLCAGALAGTLISLALWIGGAVSLWALTPWLVALAAVCSFVLLGLRAASAPRWMYAQLAFAPFFMVRKVLSSLRILKSRPTETWIRTERPSDVAGHRIDLLGVPVDFLDMDSVVEITIEAARSQRFFQIATVNLDFMVNSRRDAEVHRLLNETAVNVPDGIPLVWAARFLGLKEICRVAGADLIPGLVAAAAEANLRVFLLGGEEGAAAAAADRLLATHPGLEVDMFEPPRASLEEMDDAEILRHLERAQPHILLVAFGHPKQDKWIQRNTAFLPMAAIGVGCSLDLLAGKVSRAPGWMQRVGLEWIYRLVHEPARLCGRYAADAWWLVSDLLPWLLSERVRGARNSGGRPSGILASPSTSHGGLTGTNVSGSARSGAGRSPEELDLPVGSALGPAELSASRGRGGTAI
jgi:exopolysaccharide biosynthesis WecB/TagA/CpsF family protein